MRSLHGRPLQQLDTRSGGDNKLHSQSAEFGMAGFCFVRSSTPRSRRLVADEGSAFASDAACVTELLQLCVFTQFPFMGASTRAERKQIVSYC